MPKKAPAKASKKNVPSKDSKAIKKDDKVDKKASSGSSGTLLELGLLCDCTSSMHSWIVRAKQTL